MDTPDFYASLSPLESSYWQKLDALFKRVSARQPEKGIATLILRARAMAESESIPLAEALEAVLTGAVTRTERRIALLGHCSVPGYADLPGPPPA
jgi:hypothetical protein